MAIGQEACSLDPFVTLPHRSHFVDQQTIKLQVHIMLNRMRSRRVKCNPATWVNAAFMQSHSVVTQATCA